MPVKDKAKRQFIGDRDENVFIGIDLPFYRSDGVDGWFASTTDTISAVKNNIHNLLNTHKGERYLQPELGLNLRSYLFEQMTEELKLQIENEILDTFEFWLPFVQVRNLEVIITESDGDVGSNKLIINVLFNIAKDPNMTESIQVQIGD
tara:strand:+ start:549 stop:995 length:447 start_codon:yes stop_codon:yes gene_type:complete